MLLLIMIRIVFLVISHNLFHKSKDPKHIGDPVIRAKLRDLDKEVDKFQWFYKTKHYEEVFKDTSDTKRTWANINKVLGRDKTNSGKIEKLTVNDNVIRDDREIASTFNSFFVKIGKKIASKITGTSGINKYSTL